jgi:hypothetical protein
VNIMLKVTERFMLLWGVLFLVAASPGDGHAEEPKRLRVAVFQIDATPPLGSPLCNGSVQYIGTEVAYSQGGYETGGVSRVASQVEQVLMQAMQQLLDVK